jgi:hypothetical protein
LAKAALSNLQPGMLCMVDRNFFGYGMWSQARQTGADLQLPPGVARPPVVMHWGGVDGWKEDRLRAAAFILRAGLASLTIDMPGSGENPVLYGDPAAERTYAWANTPKYAAAQDGAGPNLIDGFIDRTAGSRRAIVPILAAAWELA